MTRRAIWTGLRLTLAGGVSAQERPRPAVELRVDLHPFTIRAILTSGLGPNPIGKRRDE